MLFLLEGNYTVTRFLAVAAMTILFLCGCDGGGSDGSDIPPGLNLFKSDCPGEDIVAIPVAEGYAWECTVIESGEAYTAGTLSGLSQAVCFETRSMADAYCGIEVLGKASFAASHHEFDLENLPPPDADGCDPELAVSIEEVECRTVLLP